MRGSRGSMLGTRGRGTYGSRGMSTNRTEGGRMNSA